MLCNSLAAKSAIDKTKDALNSKRQPAKLDLICGFGIVVDIIISAMFSCACVNAGPRAGRIIEVQSAVKRL
jgi:hypothetical protein